ncbi:Endoplasmic reticulum-Golgi intermediate compartment protein 2 [Goodea atripinnis]|uniref:Endoplasmic reticulum-Golgi intermediate compartment protein n=1 Tax=Goodea atripinnis TaxID=208336 RepID=A0ABV0NWL7_9TELE
MHNCIPDVVSCYKQSNWELMSVFNLLLSFRTLHLIQSRLREEHAVQEVLYKTLLKGAPTALPPREDAPQEPLNACRIHGHVYVNKVAGNLHITVGKPIHHPQGHAHIAAFVSHEAYNFSHRIDHLSFGEEIPGIINPLDGTDKITYNYNQMYQYFITVVPTKLNTYLISADTHQFSVTERVSGHCRGWSSLGKPEDILTFTVLCV